MKAKVLFVFLFGALFTTAQYRLSGTVYDHSNKPLQDVHIHLEKKVAYSKPNGFYAFENLNQNKYKISVSYIGYKTIDTVISIIDDLVLDFKMQQEITSLDEAIIRKQKNANKTINEDNISKNLLQTNNHKNLADILSEVSGVTTLKTGSNISKPIIHGMHSSRIPIINNGIRMEDQQWGYDHLPNIDVNTIDNLLVVKGVASLRYAGDAIGGMVIANPYSFKKDTLLGKVITALESNGKGGLFNASLYKSNTKKWFGGVSATLKYFGDKNAPNYMLSNTGNREKNLYTQLGYTYKNSTLEMHYSMFNSQNGILKASHIGNAADLYYSINLQEPYLTEPFTYNIGAPSQKVQHHFYKAAFKTWLSENSYLEANYAFQYNNRKEFDVRTGEDKNKPALDLDLATHNVIVFSKFNVNDIKIGVGSDVQFQNNISNPLTGVQPLIPTYNKYEMAFYSFANKEFNNSFILEAGLRYSFSQINAKKYFLKTRWEERKYSSAFNNFIVSENGNQWYVEPQFNYNNVSASIGFQKLFHHNYTLWFNAGLTMRNPNAAELFSDGLHHATAQIELGSMFLKGEKSIKILSTLKKEWKKSFVELTSYYQTVSNYIFLKPIAIENTIRGSFPVWEYKQTQAHFIGSDFTISKDFTLFTLQSIASYIYGYDNIAKDYITEMPPFTLKNQLRFKNLKWLNLSFSIHHQWVAKQNLYPNYNFETQIFENNNWKTVTVAISNPPKAYNLFGFTATTQFNLNKKITATSSINIDNLFNISYRNYLNRQRFFADETARNIVLKLHINF